MLQPRRKPFGSRYKPMHSQRKHSHKTVSSDQTPFEVDHSFWPSWEDEEESLSDYSEGERVCWNIPSIIPSRAIPIPRKAKTSKFAGPEEEQESVAHAERRYEMATWDMYKRIVEYRTKNPTGQNYNQELVVPENRNIPNGTNCVWFSTRNRPRSDIEIRDDEIFEMEL